MLTQFDERPVHQWFTMQNFQRLVRFSSRYGSQVQHMHVRVLHHAMPKFDAEQSVIYDSPDLYSLYKNVIETD